MDFGLARRWFFIRREANMTDMDAKVEGVWDSLRRNLSYELLVAFVLNVEAIQRRLVECAELERVLRLPTETPSE